MIREQSRTWLSERSVEGCRVCSSLPCASMLQALLLIALQFHLYRIWNPLSSFAAEVLPVLAWTIPKRPSKLSIFPFQAASMRSLWPPRLMRRTSDRCGIPVSARRPSCCSLLKHWRLCSSIYSYCHFRRSLLDLCIFGLPKL